MKKTYAAAAVILFLAAAALSYFLGYRAARRELEEEKAALGHGARTFYATVTQVYENDCFAVKGMEVNDLNFRGEFTFAVREETNCLWMGTQLSPAELEAGDNISITFTGPVLESNPAQIPNVTEVWLLDDEP